MRGYHYTSLANWWTIQHQGLQPYLIDKPEILSIFHRPVRGIFVWPQPHDPESELGTVLFQACSKETLLVVQLWVDYVEADVLKPPRHGDRMELLHDGAIGNWEYHRKKEAIIVVEPVARDCVGLVRQYDLLDLVRTPQPTPDSASSGEWSAI